MFQFISLVSFAQSGIAISGTVTDENGALLPGVNVTIKGTTVGVVTDANGKYSINVPNEDVELVFSSIGYGVQEVLLGGQTSIEVVLNEDNNTLNEVVVVGYGTQKRKELTGSIASISKANLDIQTSSFDNLLNGAVSGVHVTQSSGQPGSSSSIRIRGGNSITGGNEPLYVIDGFLVYNENIRISGASGSFRAGASLNALATINPADIESIEVLKDASATAIYGSRGANGVILVTTKKGKHDRNQVQFTGTYGYQRVAKKLDLLDAKEWAQVHNDVLASKSLPADIDPNTVENIDWQDEVFRKGAIQNYQLSISGGDDKTQYSISGNYFGQEGVLLNTGFDRYSARVNIGRTINDKFKVGVNAIGSQSTQSGFAETNSITASNVFATLLFAAPVGKVRENGTYKFDNPFVINTVTPTYNPIAEFAETINTTTAKRALGNFFAEYRIIPELTAKVNAGADLINVKQNFYAPSFTESGYPATGYGSVGTASTTIWQSEFTLNYNKQFGNHSIDVLAGYTTQKSNSESNITVASNFLNEKTTFNSLQSGDPGLPYTGAIVSVLNSWLGRANYTFRKRYNATVSLRADGSSRFAAGHNWGYFPSVGLSWNIHEEDFLNSVKNISNLKLRLSAGTTGNQEIGDYKALAVYAPNNYSFNRTVVTGYAPSNLIDPELRWETTAQYNVGIDFGVLNDRINFTVDAYYKKTNDLLFEVPVPYSSGFTSVLSNIGSVSNKGVEFSVNADVVRRKGNGFNWKSTLVLAHNRNEVLHIGDNNEFLPSVPSSKLAMQFPLIIRVGEPLGTFYGYQTDGIVQTGDQNVPVPTWKPVEAGDWKYIDQTDDGAVTAEKDKVLLGSSQPKLIFGFTNVFTYKGFDVVAVLQGSYGNKLFNALKQQFEITGAYKNTYAYFTDRWTAANPSNEVAHVSDTPTAVVSDRFIEDASYLRLKNLTIGYALPSRWAAKIKAEKARLFFTGYNLLTLTKYSGYDPEASTYEQSNLYQGIDYGVYPAARSYQFGIELIF